MQLNTPCSYTMDSPVDSEPSTPLMVNGSYMVICTEDGYQGPGISMKSGETNTNENVNMSMEAILLETTEVEMRDHRTSSHQYKLKPNTNPSSGCIICGDRCSYVCNQDLCDYCCDSVIIGQCRCDTRPGHGCVTTYMQ